MTAAAAVREREYRVRLEIFMRKELLLSSLSVKSKRTRLRRADKSNRRVGHKLLPNVTVAL
jgi:hypothetical protein